MFLKSFVGDQEVNFKDVEKRVLGEIYEETKRELKESEVKRLINEYKEKFKEVSGVIFPEDPVQQLLMGITSVFKSWNNFYAKSYRDVNDIVGIGTAVIVQSMVFGNMNKNSGSGVLFTRDPLSGNNNLYGEFISESQGEDLVGGDKTPFNISRLQVLHPSLYSELLDRCKEIEREYRDMIEVEFTVEDGELYFLQARVGKRSSRASFRIAVNLEKEGIIDKEEALSRLSTRDIMNLVNSSIAIKNEKPISSGVPTSPGAVSGRIALTLKSVIRYVRRNEKVILLKTSISQHDIEILRMVDGIITKRGGATSHASVIIRGMGKACIMACDDLDINKEKKEILLRRRNICLSEGMYISLDGATGKIYKGKKPIQRSFLCKEAKTVESWLDSLI